MTAQGRSIAYSACCDAIAEPIELLAALATPQRRPTRREPDMTTKTPSRSVRRCASTTARSRGRRAPAAAARWSPQAPSAASCTTSPTARCCPRRRWWPRWAAATRPRSPTCSPARWCSTSARAAASTCCCRPGGSARPARRTALDMTVEMHELARRNQAEAGVTNAEFLLGTIEDIPLPDVERGRDHLQLRRQPRRATSRAVLARGLPGPAAGRPARDLGHRGAPGAAAEGRRADGAVDRLHRRRAVPEAVCRDQLAEAGFRRCRHRADHGLPPRRAGADGRPDRAVADPRRTGHPGDDRRAGRRGDERLHPRPQAGAGGGR